MNRERLFLFLVGAVSGSVAGIITALILGRL